MELADISKQWLWDMEVYILWEKGLLKVYLKPRAMS